MKKKFGPVSSKGGRRRKYSKPKLTRHGELSKTALARSY